MPVALDRHAPCLRSRVDGSTPTSLRLLTWNLRHGGGTRRMPEITLALAALAPDIACLSEFRATPGSNVRALLADLGLTHHLIAPAQDTENRVMIASRWRLDAIQSDASFPAGSNRWLAARVPDLDLTLAAVHIPDDSRRTQKLACWQFLIDFARKNAKLPCVVAGDFNSGRKGSDADAPLAGAALLGAFASLGMCDVWRALHPDSRERSWHGPRGESSRIDAIFASEPLRKSLSNAYFSHAEREGGASDHSPLIACFQGISTPVDAAIAPAPGLLFAPSHQPSTSR